MSEKLYNNIVANAHTSIGSKRWGGDSADSDLDLIYDKDKAHKLLALFASHNIKYSIRHGFSDKNGHTLYNEDNIKVEINGEILNIITYYKDDLWRLDKLNVLMDVLLDSDIGDFIRKDKMFRIGTVGPMMKILFEDIPVPRV